MAVAAPSDGNPPAGGPATPDTRAGGPAARPVRALHFVRLKLRLTGNGLRGQTWRMVLFVVGVLVAVGSAVGGFALFTGAAAADGRIGPLVVAFAGAALTLGWLLLPMLFFGVDETIDPARFALLPIPRGTLLRGMLAAACVGVPAVASALALLGLVAGAGIGHGAAAAGVAFAGAVLGLLTCVLGSRALTSAFASMLRSRRVRDLAAILLAVLASSVGPLQLAASSLISHGDLDRAVRIARVLAWTPLAAPYTAYLDAAAGRWGYALARLAIAAATVAALALWWGATIESAMIGVASGGRSSARAGRTVGVVAALVPAALRRPRAGRFGGIVAREWRYWWRDPRRRASLLSMTIAGVVVPVALRAGPSVGHGGTPLPLAVAFSALLAAMVLANQFGLDASAYALHLLVGVPGRVELRARAVALLAFMVPVLVLVTVVIAVLTGVPGQLPAALGTVLGALGISAGAAALLSVLAPYAFPDSTNPFAVGGGTSGLRGMLALAGSLASGVLVAPLLLVAVFTRGPVAGSGVLAAGLVWGGAGLLAGTRLAGDILDQRGPEILAAVTPRR
ncbi:ABC transporter permease [Planosporangium sp. 12N6]|uniref:ABC transporter permease n=1 Tax=Planosporangium spinosum TaxID=3402278 RepID=UPI003CFAFE97